MSYQECRKIVFCGFDSLSEGLRICSEKSKTSGAEIRTATDVLAYRDGAITTYTSRGPAKLTYCFIIHEEDRASVEAKARYIINQLTGKKGDLIDSDCPGKKYTNAIFMGAESLEYPERIFEAAYLTLSFEADPVLKDANEINDRVLKFADVLGSSDTATIAVTISGYTVTKHDGTTATGTLPSGLQKYRLVAFCENDPTITMGATTITPNTAFVLPDDSTITIRGGGYGYYELWHDTRMGVRLCERGDNL